MLCGTEFRITVAHPHTAAVKPLLMTEKKDLSGLLIDIANPIRYRITTSAINPAGMGMKSNIAKDFGYLIRFTLTSWSIFLKLNL